MKKLNLLATTTVTALACTALALAQGPHGPGGFGGGPGGGPGGMIRFMGFEGGRPGAVVKGAPFSAKEVTAESQTLANGTKINRSMTAQFYRDTDGRTRVERTFSGLGPWGGGTPKTMITIFDPVAGVSYMLDPEKSTATKLTLPTNIGERAGNRHTPPESDQVTTVDLGTQTIQGLVATGTRTTRTIPAGQIGNDQALTIVNERWYSADLQIAVQTKHSDPRSGEVDFTLENVSRSNPDASLFVPPANYTVSTKARRSGDFLEMHPAPPPPEQ